jgi:hypothetical protein
MLNQPSKDQLNAPDDYARTLKKQYQKRDVPQLRQQAKQSIPPLKVFSKEVPQGLDMDEDAKLAAQMGMTMAQLLSGAELPKAAIAWKYVHGQPLVDNENLHQMPTHMRNLHAWYLVASKREKSMTMAKVTEEYYFSEGLIHIEFSELFSVNESRCTQQISHELLLSVSCSIHCL